MQKNNWKALLNLALPGLIALGLMLGCSEESKEETRKWREKELKAQDSRADLGKRADEFANIKAPEKLTKEPYLKSKIVIAYTWADGKNEIMENNMHRMLMHANSKEEAKSLLKVKCSEAPAGKYVFEGNGKEVPAFSSKCQTELYDLSIPALIYRRDFDNMKLDETIKEGFFGKTPEKVVAKIPLKEIENFVRELPEK